MAATFSSLVEMNSKKEAQENGRQAAVDVQARFEDQPIFPGLCIVKHDEWQSFHYTFPQTWVSWAFPLKEEIRIKTI